MEKTVVQETPVPEIVDEDIDVENLLPMMTTNAQEMIPQEECIIGDKELTDLYDEVLNNSRDDRKKIDEVLTNFIDMVMNDGESSSASKEAIVNLLKIRSETNDKMAKIADLKARHKLKEKDTYPRYLAAQQNNKVVITGDSNKRTFLKMLQKAKEKGKE